MPGDKTALNSPSQVDKRQVTDWSDMISWKKTESRMLWANPQNMTYLEIGL